MLPKSWKKLEAHQQKFNTRVEDLFAQNPHRFKQFSLQAGELLFDYSKQQVQEETLTLLCDLAEESHLREALEGLFTGQPINRSEKRPVLHTALRDVTETPLTVQGREVKSSIKAVLHQLEEFSDKVRNQEYLSASQRPFKDILCLGIGGSELGPALLNEALTPYKTASFHLHFVSNVDSSLSQVLKQLDPRETLCIISSKTFTTPETIQNAKAVKAWYRTALGSEAEISRNMAAVTAHRDRAEKFGILPDLVFEFWDWVGGRYSVWSAVGLPAILALGMSHFKEFLSGAYAMDQHFRTRPFRENMPVLMGLLGIWNRNFRGYPTQLIMPYDQRLNRLPSYLQQLEMESNGKSISLDNHPVPYETAPILWGGVGCNGQHAFMQLLHQGSQIVPVDFIIGIQGEGGYLEHQKLLFASCLAQAKALMEGVAVKEDPLAAAKSCSGNRPSSLLVYPKLSPSVLGSLIALYEHKVFVQGVIWGINSFDQWGVELGKTLSKTILAELDNPTAALSIDGSTKGLIDFFWAKNQN